MQRERAHTEILLSGSKSLSLSSTQIANGILITNLPPEYEKRELFNFFRKAGLIDYFICCKEQVIFIFANSFGKECAGIYDRIRFGSSEIEIVLQDLEARDLQNMGSDFEKIDIGMLREKKEDNASYEKRKSILYEEGGKCVEEDEGRGKNENEGLLRGEKARVSGEGIGKGKGEKRGSVDEGEEKEKEGKGNVGGKQGEGKERGRGRRVEQEGQNGGEQKKTLELDGRWEKEGGKRGIDGQGVTISRGLNNDQNTLRNHNMKKMKEINLSIIEESDFLTNESIISQEEVSLSQRKSSLSKAFPSSSSAGEASFNKISAESTDFSKLIQNIDTNLTKMRVINQQFQRQKNDDNPSFFQQKDQMKNLKDETQNDDNFNKLSQNTNFPIHNQSFNPSKKSIKKLNEQADYKNLNKASQNEILSIDDTDFFPKRKHSKKQKNDFQNEDSVGNNDNLELLHKKTQNDQNNKENINPLQPNQNEGFQFLNDSFMENEEKDENQYLNLEEGDEEILKTCNFNEIEENNLFSEGRDRLLFDVEEEDQEKVFHTLKIKENSLRKVYLHQDIFRDNVINTKYAKKMLLLWMWAYGIYTVVWLIQRLF